ncbi:MAG: Glu/Leu/Phe/Val dehydrogenase [Pseudomonadales bacterium]|jgi:glutamate dehydrogenase
MYDFLEQGTRLLRLAGATGEIDDDVLEMLSAPSRVVTFRIAVKMDNGRIRFFDACRVRYNDALGPSRDGTRVSPDFEVAEAKALALLMTIKHAAGHIPAGGGKGGIAADPGELSAREFEALIRAYMRELRPSGAAYDVPGADMGTDLQTMAWMLDEYESIHGYHQPSAVNDKPPILGGSLGGFEATGAGVVDSIKSISEQMDLEIDGATFAIQGFGQVGSVAAAQLNSAGARLVAISDRHGGVYREQGIDLAALVAHGTDGGKVSNFPGGDRITNAELLECNCDALIPAAVQGVITDENADRIKARLLIEAANGPTTLEADSILMEKGVTIIPDILANAGSVHVCQMERSQGLYDNYWDAETIDSLRRQRLIASLHEARSTAVRYKVESMRLGAWINALKRIENAAKMRGWC